MKLAANSFLRSFALISGLIAVAVLCVPISADAARTRGRTRHAQGFRRDEIDPDLDLGLVVAEFEPARQRLRPLPQQP